MATSKSDREELATIARRQVRRAVLEVVEETGREIVTRPVIRDQADSVTVTDASPADGLVIARAIELQARRRLKDYFRDCREAGMSWHKIGVLLGLEHEAEANDTTVAAMAWETATGPVRRGGWTDYRSFAWRCGACGQSISDEGPLACPDSSGHAASCRRLPAEIRAYYRESE